jgi:aspartyl-tRNA(Asn)/glutamyl-tRNA(Gln) amidotransferase subunit A
MIDLTTLTISQAHKDLVSKKYSVRDLVDAYKAEITQRDTTVHAFLEVYKNIDAQIIHAQKLIDEGKATVLTGIPFAVKDNILVKGEIASSGSRILESYHGTYDATVITKLKQAGAVLIGRTNMDEFAMGGSTEKSAFGPTRNPLDESRVPGGTSGGSAAAVAANMVLAALGSDTGGSIRQPASFCGVVGIKGSYGSVSRYGLMAAVSSFDQIGPLTKNVEDAETVFNIIQGKDEMDATSVGTGEKKLTAKMKIGVPKKFIESGGIQKEVLDIFNASVEKFKKLGYEIVDITLPHIDFALPTYYILNFAEISSNMSRYDGVRYGKRAEGNNLNEEYTKTRGEFLGKEVRRRIMLGTYVLSAGYYDAYYGKANAMRAKIKEDYENAFNSVDFVLTPVAPTLPFKIGEKVSDPLALYLEDIFTVTANLAGMPALSMPGGWVDYEGNKLAVGIQLLGPRFGEQLLFEAGRKFETIG